MAVGLSAASTRQVNWRAGGSRPRPHRAIDRVSEARHYVAGRRDGYRSLPVLDLAAAPPAHLQRIRTALSGVLDRRWTALLVRTDADRLALSRLLPELDRAEARRDVAGAELAAHTATPVRYERRYGEERIPEDLVRRRRNREHAERTAELTAERDRTRNYVSQLGQQRAELESRMALLLEIAQSEAREQHRLFSLGTKAYLRGAQRTHHDPEALVRLTPRFEFDLPTWVSLDGLLEFLRAAGAESDARS